MSSLSSANRPFQVVGGQVQDLGNFDGTDTHGFLAKLDETWKWVQVSETDTPWKFDPKKKSEMQYFKNTNSSKKYFFK
jgi:hypothetical protein